MDSLEEELLETFKVENYGEGEEVEIPEDVLIEFKGYYHDLMKN